MASFNDDIPRYPIFAGMDVPDTIRPSSSSSDCLAVPLTSTELWPVSNQVVVTTDVPSNPSDLFVFEHAKNSATSPVLHEPVVPALTTQNLDGINIAPVAGVAPQYWQPTLDGWWSSKERTGGTVGNRVSHASVPCVDQNMATLPYKRTYRDQDILRKINERQASLSALKRRSALLAKKQQTSRGVEKKRAAASRSKKTVVKTEEQHNYNAVDEERVYISLYYMARREDGSMNYFQKLSDLLEDLVGPHAPKRHLITAPRIKAALKRMHKDERVQLRKGGEIILGDVFDRD